MRALILAAAVLALAGCGDFCGIHDAIRGQCALGSVAVRAAWVPVASVEVPGL